MSAARVDLALRRRTGNKDPMIANMPNTRLTSASLRTDLLLIAFLIGLVAAARLLPHAPNFTPVVAAALFAGTALRCRSLALAVPVAAMLLSDAIIGHDSFGVTIVVYATLTLPALIGIAARRFRVSRMFLPAVLSSSLVFFATSNLAVWAFGDLYSRDLAGLVQCYVAALPFLHQSVAGDLFWSAVLFGGAYLVQRACVRRRPHALAAEPGRAHS
jgi:hypothetical protein